MSEFSSSPEDLYYHGNVSTLTSGNTDGVITKGVCGADTDFTDRSTLFRNNFDRVGLYGSYPVGSRFPPMGGFQWGCDTTYGVPPLRGLVRGGVADHFISQMLRQGDLQVFKRYRQARVNRMREALAKMHRNANEHETNSVTAGRN